MNMEERYEARRRMFKATADAAETRQQEALELQESQREDHMEKIRATAFAAAMGADDMEVEIEVPSKKNNKRKNKKLRKCAFFSRQFMVPDWLIQVPAGIQDEWLVYVRPEGERYLLFSDGGYCRLVKRKTGKIVKKFQDARFPRGQTILEGVFLNNGTLICFDLLAWGDCGLENADFECRNFFLCSRIVEDPAWHTGEIKLNVVDVGPVTKRRLQDLYQRFTNDTDAPYVPDGFQFVHRQVRYCTGLTPLSLIWKDNKLSQYTVDTPVADTIPTEEVCVLEQTKKGFLRTEDRVIVSQGAPVDKKCFVRCRVIDWNQADQKKLGIEIIGKSGPQRVVADSWSRILVQHFYRTTTPGENALFEELLQAVEASN